MTNPGDPNKEVYSKVSSETDPTQVDPTISELRTALQEKIQHEQQWMALCERAAAEKDPKKLLELVSEINRLFQFRKEHLAKAPAGDPSGKLLR
ncbi:MAG: hypothetical protein WAM78_01195 [Candidatus Sulfotelmatobacter sp.]